MSDKKKFNAGLLLVFGVLAGYGALTYLSQRLGAAVVQPPTPGLPPPTISLADIAITVLDDHTNAPILTARLTADGFIGKLDGPSGVYLFNDIPEGTYSVLIEAVGYNAQIATVTALTGSPGFRTVYLVPTAVPAPTPAPTPTPSPILSASLTTSLGFQSPVTINLGTIVEFTVAAQLNGQLVNGFVDVNSDHGEVSGRVSMVNGIAKVFVAPRISATWRAIVNQITPSVASGISNGILVNVLTVPAV